MPSEFAPSLKDGQLEIGRLEDLPDVKSEADEDDIDECHYRRVRMREITSQTGTRTTLPLQLCRIEPVNHRARPGVGGRDRRMQRRGRSGGGRRRGRPERGARREEDLLRGLFGRARADGTCHSSLSRAGSARAPDVSTGNMARYGALLLRLAPAPSGSVPPIVSHTRLPASARPRTSRLRARTQPAHVQSVIAHGRDKD